ncbi:MAG: glycosyltransferase family 2 protein, partial [Acidobacteriota bacterium]
MTDNTFVVVPAYNEAGSIGTVVAELVASYPNVVVVDDGSSDGTLETARQAGATVLRHVINRGQGAALQTGIDFALACGASYVVTFDSDGQHLVSDLSALLGPVREG